MQEDKKNLDTVNVLFLHSQQVTNYYHILVDFLPTAHSIIQTSRRPTLYFDGPITRPALFAQIVAHLYGNAAAVKSSSDPSNKTVIEYDSTVESINDDFVTFLKQIRVVVADSPSKILIKRKSRYLSEEIVTLLVQQGFVEVAMEDYSIKEQANFLYNARHVVAPHGAGLSNILFAGPQTKVLELNNGFNRDCFLKLACFSEGQYSQLVSESYDPNNRTTKESTFVMDLNCFKAHLFDVFLEKASD